MLPYKSFERQRSCAYASQVARASDPLPAAAALALRVPHTVRVHCGALLCYLCFQI